MKVRIIKVIRGKRALWFITSSYGYVIKVYDGNKEKLEEEVQTWYDEEVEFVYETVMT